MKWWRIRKVTGVAAGQLLVLGTGVLMGVALIAFMPGMPWSNSIVGYPDNAALDLAAQRSMASAAWWMVVITATSSAVGIAGVFLLARTLIEARRSAIAGEKVIEATLWIGQRQVRAYLSVSSATCTLNAIGMTLTVDLANTGQSPASEILGTAKMLVQEMETYEDGHVVFIPLFQQKKLFRANPIGTMQEAKAQVNFILMNTDFFTPAITGDSMTRRLNFEIEATYKDVFADVHELKAELSTLLPSIQNLKDIPLTIGR